MRPDHCFRIARAGVFGLLVGLACTVFAGGAFAQGGRSLPPMSVYQAILKANKASGWVQFRNFNGRQYIYFTALQTMHCRLAEIRYSINSEALDKNFALVPCNPALPFSLPPKSGLKEIAIRLPLGTADTVTVQVVWQDGNVSETLTYQPCSNVGEQSCALPVE